MAARTLGAPSATPLSAPDAPPSDMPQSKHFARERPAQSKPFKTPKSESTRERILNVAFALITERGSTSFPMSDVSARCGMSKGALYYYFADRDDLLAELLDRNAEALVSALEHACAMSLSARAALTALCKALVDHLTINVAFAPALLSDAFSGRADADSRKTWLTRAAAVVRAQLERGIAEGVVRSNVNLDLAAVSVLGSFIMAVLNHLTHAQIGSDSKELVDELVALALEGIGAA